MSKCSLICIIGLTCVNYYIVAYKAIINSPICRPTAWKYKHGTWCSTYDFIQVQLSVSFHVVNIFIGVVKVRRFMYVCVHVVCIRPASLKISIITARLTEFCIVIIWLDREHCDLLILKPAHCCLFIYITCNSTLYIYIFLSLPRVYLMSNVIHKFICQLCFWL